MGVCILRGIGLRSIKRGDRNLRNEALKVMMNKSREVFLTIGLQKVGTEI